MVARNAAAETAGTMIDAMKSLYLVSQDINVFINEHIGQLKQSDNPNIQIMGKVLEGAKTGFGIGFITPVTIMAAGQLLLGNPLIATGVIVTSPFNPIAMTSAAVGAVYFGWNALNDEEKANLLDNLSQGLQIGIELVRSIILFAIEKMEQFLNSDSAKEIKEWITTTIDSIENWCSDTCDDVCKTASDLIVKSKNFFGELFSSKPDVDASENSGSENSNDR